MVRDAMRGYWALASGLTELTRQRAMAAARALVSQGEATAEQVGAIAEDLLSTSASNRTALVNLVRAEIDRARAAVGVATSAEIGQLSRRVEALEARLAAGASDPAAKPATGPAKKSAAAPAAASKRAKKAASASAAMPATGAPVKRSRSTPTKQSPTKRSPTKQSPTKRSPTKALPAESASAGPAALPEAPSGRTPAEAGS